MLERRRIRRSYAGEKTMMMGIDWPSCWDGCTIRERVLPIKRTFGTFWCRRRSMSFGSLTLIGIGRAIVAYRWAWAQTSS